MAEHFCQYIVGWRTGLGEDGDPVFCDRPASIKVNKAWLCAEHYDDELMVSEDRHWRKPA